MASSHLPRRYGAALAEHLWLPGTRVHGRLTPNRSLTICTTTLCLRYDSRSAFLLPAGVFPMKTLSKMVFVLVLALCVPTLLIAQSKTGDRTKKSGGNPQKTVANSDKKTSDDGDKDAAKSATPTKLEDNKSKDPLENVKFRNLGPAVGGGRVTSVVGIPGKPNVYYVGAAGGGGCW